MRTPRPPLDWGLLALVLVLELAAAVVIVLATASLQPAPVRVVGPAEFGQPPCGWWERRAGLCVILTEPAIGFGR